MDMTKILRILGSVRLALWLLCAVIAVSFIGAVAPEGLQPKIFYSPWFLALLAAFGVNLLACLAARVWAPGRSFGSKLTHGSIPLILAGCLVSFLTGQKGTIEFTKGEAATSFIAENGQRPLGFSVKLEDFTVEWYRPQYFKLGAVVEDRKLRKKFDAVPGREYKVADTGYAFTIKGYFPDFSVNEEGMAENLSDKALNPTLLVEITSPQGSESRWVFARHPDISMGRDRNIRIVFLQEPLVKEFRSRLLFSDGKRRVERDVKVNGPVSFGGYTFYQSGYDPDKPEWTALEVVKDPGVPFVFAGFLFLNIGIIALYGRRWLAGRRG
jgi:cytochrome c biogenesis protein ResB